MSPFFSPLSSLVALSIFCMNFCLNLCEVVVVVVEDQPRLYSIRFRLPSLQHIVLCNKVVSEPDCRRFLMASVKVELPMLDRKTKFIFCKITMWGVLAQLDLEDALVFPMPKSWHEDKKKWINRKSMTQIKLHLYNDILRDVQTETQAHNLWSRLTEICMAKTITRRNLAQQWLFGLRIVEGTSLESHLTNFKDIMAELDALDANALIASYVFTAIFFGLSRYFVLWF